jgi:hypothetical protein
MLLPVALMHDKDRADSEKSLHSQPFFRKGAIVTHALMALATGSGRGQFMDNIDFFKRLGGTDSEAMLARAQSDAGPSLPPLYLYFTSAAWVMNVLACFRPEEDGFVILNAGPIVKTGKMVFNTNVSWSDQGTQRTGWIHTWEIDGEPMVMFLPDFSDGQYYQGCVTTLPYTLGQPPSGLDQPVGFWRSAIGWPGSTENAAPAASEPTG